MNELELLINDKANISTVYLLCMQLGLESGILFRKFAKINK